VRRARRPRSTRARLATAVGLVFLAVAAAASTGLWFAFQSAQYTTIDASLSGQAQALIASLQDANGHLTFDSADPLAGQTSEGIAVAALLVDGGGRALDSSGGAPSAAAVAPAVRAALSGHAIVTETLSINGLPERVVAQPVDTGGGGTAVLAVLRPVNELRSTLLQLGVALAAVVLLLTAAVWLLAHRLTGRTLQPVRAIAATARDITEHDLHRRVDLALPSDELGELAATFNAMLGRLEAGFAALQQFTADAAHELRAPLAVLRAELEVSLGKQRSTGEHVATERVALVEIERLSVIADQLLTLARAEAGALVPDAQAVDLGDLVDETVERWRPLARGKRVSLRAEVVDEGAVIGDPHLLRRVLDNLLDNAVRHSPAGGAVTVRLRRDGASWRLAVADSGPGVAPAVRGTLFERFTRGDEARGRDTGGAGLGLALCRAIATVHGGSVSLLDTPPGSGATFELTLPAAAAPALQKAPAGRDG
jgi:heavy metal sensor kinase